MIRPSCSSPHLSLAQLPRKGVFSVKSAYKMLIETKRRREDYFEERPAPSNAAQDEGSWKKLWKVRVPSKVRIFAWRLARSSLPTGAERVRRHMADSLVCPIYNAATDDWRHSLLTCNMAASVWAMREDDLVLPLFSDETENPRQWLFSLSKSLNQEQFVQMLVTLWAIWWARRKYIHEGEQQPPLSTHLFIQRYLDELKIVHTPSMISWVVQGLSLHGCHLQKEYPK
jgi:hypothetical protein